MKKNLRQNNQWNKGEENGTRKGTAFWKRKLEKTKFKPAKAKIEVEKSYMVEKRNKLLNMADWILSEGEGYGNATYSFHTFCHQAFPRGK